MSSDAMHERGCRYEVAASSGWSGGAGAPPDGIGGEAGDAARRAARWLSRRWVSRMVKPARDDLDERSAYKPSMRASARARA